MKHFLAIQPLLQRLGNARADQLTRIHQLHSQDIQCKASVLLYQLLDSPYHDDYESVKNFSLK
tara:strand:- start:227 stop:415 length:189 start_codon:yes stop_codon:yes gene_type:complete